MDELAQAIGKAHDKSQKKLWEDTQSLARNFRLQLETNAGKMAKEFERNVQRLAEHASRNSTCAMMDQLNIINEALIKKEDAELQRHELEAVRLEEVRDCLLSVANQISSCLRNVARAQLGVLQQERLHTLRVEMDVSFSFVIRSQKRNHVKPF